MKVDEDTTSKKSSSKRLSLRGCVDTLSYWCSRKCQVRGFDVGILLQSKSRRSAILVKLERSLGLIAQYSPVQNRRVQCNLARLFVFRIPPNLAEYHPNSRMCFIDCDYLISKKLLPEELAMTIVHETTHANLTRRGFGYDPATRSQVERICVRAEIAFAKRLPDGASLAQSAIASLDRGEAFWSDEEFLQRDLKALRTLNMPAWFIRLAEWGARRKRKTPRL